MLQSQNIQRLPESGVVTLSTYALVSGSTLPKHGQFASLDAVKAVSSDLLVYLMGQIGTKGGGHRRRGLRLSFGGTGADNSDLAFKIYAAFAGEGGQRTLRLLGTVAATLSATTGASGLHVDASTVRIADTITWTESAWYTAERAALGISAASAYSPGSDLEAVLDIADTLGASEIIIDTDLGTATGGIVMAEGWT